ncbi:MAG: glycosyltransferase family 4 protein, partial [Cyanothece sp. SIO1E1]|nr:glycosyltransferase family 4 protein [Cyanothece sp. SIO1E1]
GHSENERVIDISADATVFSPTISGTCNKIRIHYGGQLGRMHDAASLVNSIKAFNGLETSGYVSFDFMISGAQSSVVQSELESEGISISNAIPSDEWRKYIDGFDIGLVSLLPGGATVCLPSKTYSMMAGGLAILAVCPLWSDLAKLILENKVGWVVSNSPYINEYDLLGDDYLEKVQQKRAECDIVDEFVVVLKDIIENPDEIIQKRHRARNCMLDKYGEGNLSREWEIALGQLV